ncbi:sensor histidine kinase [Flavobacterium hiemivividum]|uniref:histidine kinase n=1 Tax=Flavobacterium hiemivividum TaxID=2541734 RepID=A0A4R5D104_9FLAO|nr:ATP-binding protein [Flavobacterium hiemivividum]TDE03863.1 two-component sensor histidine kinase [Flavobacterium hiemivividum]
MHKIRFLLLLLLLSIVYQPIFSQTKSPSKKEIIELSNEATRLMNAGKYEQSLIKSRAALQFAIAIKDDNTIASCYNTIAANFDELSEFDKAFFYYKKGLLYADKANNDELKNWLYNNLGNIYCFDKKEYKKGIYYYKKSLDYSRKVGDSVQIVFTNLNITWAYFDIGDFKSGEPYLKFINKHHDKFGDESTIVALNMLNAMYYGYKNEPKKAVSFFENAIALGNKGNEKSDLSFTHQEYSRFLLKNGNYKKAYENLAAYNDLTAALSYKEKLKKINVAGINLEIDEYKREIDNIETKYKTKEQLLIEKQSKNKQISIIIISLLLLIIILSYFFFQNTKLKQQNKLNDIQSKIQENIINASINGQEQERKKIANFLHDNISALLSSAGLHLSVFSSKNKIESEEIEKTKAILKRAHNKVRDLSHELLPSLLSRFGLFYALNDLCEQNSNSSMHFEYSSTVDEKTRYNVEFEMKMYFIVMELLNNVIKHSGAGSATLSLLEVNDELLIHVWDNGAGFDTNDYNAIIGFGLNQIQARINNMKGEIVVQSKLNSGTSVHIKVPILHAD